MSDDTVVPASSIPAAPVPPVAPVAAPVTPVADPVAVPEVTTPETPAEPATGLVEPSVDTAADTEETSAPEDTETPVPTVVNTADGQHVVMPDGTQVYTRNHPYPVSNSEWAQFEKTHSGDQARYSYVPGDKEYDAFSDPHVPNSSMAQNIMSEIASFGERVLLNPNAVVSTIWNSVKGIFDSELENFTKSGVGAGKIVE